MQQVTRFINLIHIHTPTPPPPQQPPLSIDNAIKLAYVATQKLSDSSPDEVACLTLWLHCFVDDIKSNISQFPDTNHLSDAVDRVAEAVSAIGNGRCSLDSAQKIEYCINELETKMAGDLKLLMSTRPPRARVLNGVKQIGNR